MRKFESSRQNRLRTRLWKCFCYGELDYDISKGSKGAFLFANTGCAASLVLAALPLECYYFSDLQTMKGLARIRSRRTSTLMGCSRAARRRHHAATEAGGGGHESGEERELHRLVSNVKLQLENLSPADPRPTAGGGRTYLGWRMDASTPRRGNAHTRFPLHALREYGSTCFRGRPTPPPPALFEIENRTGN